MFEVSGRGELHLTILIENMRREGFELAVSRPRVVFKMVDGVRHEPYENLSVDVEEVNQGGVMEELGRRRGDLQNMESDGKGRVRLEYRSRAWPDRLPGRIHDPDPRHRPDEPRVRRIRTGRQHQGRNGRPSQRRADLAGRRRRRRLRDLEAAGPRPHVRGRTTTRCTKA
jgi:hypothetical protein